MMLPTIFLEQVRNERGLELCIYFSEGHLVHGLLFATPIAGVFMAMALRW